jgi:hypothetical protein
VDLSDGVLDASGGGGGGGGTKGGGGGGGGRILVDYSQAITLDRFTTKVKGGGGGGVFNGRDFGDPGNDGQVLVQQVNLPGGKCVPEPFSVVQLVCGAVTLLGYGWWKLIHKDAGRHRRC